MENTLENKAKFFAQYWGQKELFHTNSRPYFITFETLTNSIESIECYSAYLKPLSLITDEDANRITIYGQYAKENNGFNQNGYHAPQGFQWYSSASIDYLRSKGYALPWMGLSVENLVEYGWVKLNEAK